MTDDDLVTDLLIDWEAAFDRGTDVPADELCRDCPHLTDRVADRISRLKATEWLRRPASGTATAPIHREGDVLAGNYRLEGLIGEGGYGVVWRAVDLTLNRPVAIKVPRRRSVAPAEDDPFLAEARRVAQLKHPGIVPVHFIGRDGDSYFIVTELIDGENLAASLAQNSLTVQKTVRVVQEVADVLAYAHAQGFVHRDVKPANILLDRNGRAYLTDFGIAVAMADAPDGGWEAAGTPAYMAPELIQSDGPVSGSCDVFALGVVLYEALTGRHPFPAKDESGYGAATFNWAVIRPQLFNHLVPILVELACLQCLEKEPGKRLTAEALAAALSPTRRRAAIWVAAAAVLLAAASSANPLVRDVRLRPWDTYVFPHRQRPLPHQLPDLIRAVTTYTVLIRDDPNDADAFFYRGLAHLHLHEENRAVVDFSSVLSLRPNDARAYLHRGVAFHRLALNDRAVADLNEVLRLNPSDAEARHWLDLVNGGRRGIQSSGATGP